MMSKENIKDLVNAIETGDNVKATDAFQAAMINKQADAIDSKRLDVQMNWMEKESGESESEEV
tara:strand:- start:2 stop:190 length:189 start_codon:yes stop_codon:yes gene_type:complete